MRVKCVLCDGTEKIDPYALVAKRIRNRPLTTYMCTACNERITENTIQRKSRNGFRYDTFQVQESNDW